MTTLKTSSDHHRDKKFLLVLTGLNLLGLIATLVFFHIILTTKNAVRLKVFNGTAEVIQQRVEERMLAHVNLLRGLRAFWAGSGQIVTREQFDDYLKELNAFYDFPGISSISYLELQGDKLITKYIHPLEGRETTLGLDQYFDPQRQSFFELTRDNGQINASQPFILQTTKKSGFFLAVPLYQKGQIPNSQTERKTQLIGFIGMVFRENELFNAIFGRQNPFPDHDFAIYHQEIISPNHLLYDSDPDFNPQSLPANKLMQKQMRVSIGQTPWVIVVTAKPAFKLTPLEETLPYFILIISLGLSAIAGWYNLKLYRRHLKTWH